MAEVSQMGALPVQHPAGIVSQNWGMSLPASIISSKMCVTLFSFQELVKSVNKEPQRFFRVLITPFAYG